MTNLRHQFRLFSRTTIRTTAFWGVLLLAVAQVSFGEEKKVEKYPPLKKDKDGWITLFDGKTLKGWEITKFGGEGEVAVKGGAIEMGFGTDLTGIHTERELPKTNYEVELEAMRVDGTDFFCGMTFPVKKDPCSLILGGWGGGVCGLSSIDDMDASENETTTYRAFKNKKWYKIRLKVTDKKIEAWLDGKQIVEQDLKGKKISIRYEVELSKPFGFACWQTSAALKNIRIRSLADAPKPEAKPKKKDS
ncbi:MAG: DUF1080 domain-containing protein [Planctomycetaceae bacterium]|nr:DUF1080 domain-containing protein [Planctomycetaceae bacterium]